MSPLILVTAATGIQGGSTARHLLSKNIPVRAFVRNPSSPAALALQKLGADIVKGDFEDVPAITAATAGVTGVFLNTYPSFTDPSAEVRYAQNFVTAAVAAGTVKTFVVSTAFKASEYLALISAPETKDRFPFMKFYFERKAGVEDVVKGAAFDNTTILRPGWLNYNYLAPGVSIHFPEFEKEHVLAVSYSKEHKQNHFDPEDVGKFAAAAFVQPERFSGTINLAFERLTFDEVADIIGRVAGIVVKSRFRTEEETKALLESGTLPALQSQLFFMEHSFVPESLEKYGIELGTLEGYLKRERERLLTTLNIKE